MSVEVLGDGAVHSWLEGMPARFATSVQAATERGVRVQAQRIEADTPRRTGRLAASWQTQVLRTQDGAQGRVFSTIAYGPYVEHGTRYMAGRHMAERGTQETGEQLAELYEAAAARALEEGG